MERFVAVDVETARPKHICQIGVVVFEGEKLVHSYETLVNPECEFAPWNVKIHGITEENVVHAPKFPEIYPVLVTLLNENNVVAYSTTDQQAIEEMCVIYGLMPPQSDWIDIYRVAKIAVKTPVYTLPALAKRCGVHHDPKHDALMDAKTVGMIAVKIAQQMDMDIAELDHIQGGPQEWTPLPYQISREHAMCLENQTVVFTGKFVWESREQLELYAALLGAKVATSVSRKTDFVVIGVEPGPSKMKDITAFGTKTVSEENFLDMIGLKYRPRNLFGLF